MNTTIYALTDSHQESRNLSRLLCGIYNFEKNSQKPFLVLDAGDLFKGIYDKELSINAYLKLKKLLPHAQIYITLGNNDFGFTKSDFEYLKTTIKRLQNAGIHVICANLNDLKTNTRVTWVEDYHILEVNNKRILITGFCLNNSCAKKFQCDLVPSEPCFDSIIKKAGKNFDKIIVLNHHWYPYSKNLKDFSKTIGAEIDLIIGGHEHSPIQPDYINNIFYPLSFARTMYRIELDSTINSIQEIKLNDIEFLPEFEQPIIEYEIKTSLKTPLAKRVMDLTKCYSDPCPLGTFISDNMKKAGNTDIAFHSTGFTMYPLRLEDSNIITQYDLKRVMCETTSTIEKIEITVEQLKKVFEHATTYRMLKDRGNARFLQCSRNIKITGQGNEQDKTYKIMQIEIDGEKLLDENQNPISPARTYSCTIDDFIGAGQQGFEVLKPIPKAKILKDGVEIPLSTLFYTTVCEASNKTNKSQTYPSFEIIDL